MAATTMPSGSAHAIIAGGSLAGLMTGVVLLSLGYSVTILERSPTSLFSDQGAGIVAGPDTLQFFRHFDLTGTELTVRSSGGRQYLDKQGAIRQAEPRGQEMTSWTKLYYILRANFDGFRKDGFVYGPRPFSGRGGVYRLDSKVTTFEVGGGRVRVRYASSTGQEQQIEGDILVGADGASSSIRSIVSPAVKRINAGYVAFRGLVSESSLSQEAARTFVDKFTFYHGPGTQALCYMIAGPNGSIKRGSRSLNWVWYRNFEPGSKTLSDILTESNGRKHTWTLPPGTMTKNTAETHVRTPAWTLLPPQFRDIIHATRQPFAQVVSDVLAKDVVFYDGHVLLVGDAVCGPRPHTAASTSQAAVHALLLYASLSRDPGQYRKLKQTWEPTVIDHAERLFESGKAMGDRSQFTQHPHNFDRTA